jgi:hypothetical protein
VPHVLLRHGWYLENFAGRATTALQTGVLLTCAARLEPVMPPTDAQPCYRPMVMPEAPGLAGSNSFSMTEFAALIGAYPGA